MEYYGPHIFQAGFSSDSITLSQSPGPVFNRECKSLSPFPPQWIWRVWQHSLYPCTAQQGSLHFILSVLPACTASKVSHVWAGAGGELGKNTYWEASDDSIFFSSVCFHLIFFKDLLERISFISYLYVRMLCFLALVPYLEWLGRTIQR